MERLLLTAEEVAEALNIGRTRVYSLIASKELTSVKIGHLRRIPVDAVREYAARLIEMEHAARLVEVEHAARPVEVEHAARPVEVEHEAS